VLHDLVLFHSRAAMFLDAGPVRAWYRDPSSAAARRRPLLDAGAPSYSTPTRPRAPGSSRCISGRRGPAALRVSPSSASRSSSRAPWSFTTAIWPRWSHPRFWRPRWPSFRSWPSARR
jgi:hypothetical protein